MMLQVIREYSGLPDYRTMTLQEFRMFYLGLKDELIKYGKTGE